MDEIFGYYALEQRVQLLELENRIILENLIGVISQLPEFSKKEELKNTVKKFKSTVEEKRLELVNEDSLFGIMVKEERIN